MEESVGRIERPEEEKFLYLGNVLWLDFVNTKIARRGKPVDLLTTWDDVMAWFAGAEAANGFPVSQTRIAESPDALPMLREFRAELLAVVFQAEESGTVLAESLNILNRTLAAHIGFNQLRLRDDAISLYFQSEVTTPRHLLALIAESAADTLAHGDLSLLRKCENPGCVLHFYDTTKNHARRWCSMGACGNRAKAAAHYQRRKGTVEARS